MRVLWPALGEMSEKIDSFRGVPIDSLVDGNHASRGDGDNKARCPTGYVSLRALRHLVALVVACCLVTSIAGIETAS